MTAQQPTDRPAVSGASDEAIRPMTARPGGPLRGTVKVPGDKSISHRAVMFGGLAVGETRILDVLTGEDVVRTAEAFRALGARVDMEEDGSWRVRGVGIGGLTEPADVLDMGNSGTAARLLLGVLAGHGITAFLTGDASLRKRPMGRVTVPLSMMGAQFTSRSGGRLPLAITGKDEPVPIEYELPVASAQVKSAILLAGLAARGATTVIERQATRDHTERLLRHFGATVTVEDLETGGRRITVSGQPELTAPADPIRVPADPSSAGFPVVAALIADGSEIFLPNVGLNETRTGLYTTLIEMGAEITIANRRDEGGEPVGDFTVKASALKGIEVPPERAPSMIDEYPILAVAAAYAEGKTVMRGIHELRVKESDRLAAVAALLRENGVTVEDGEDWIVVHGTGQGGTGQGGTGKGAAGKGGVPGGGTVETHLDHRIAMSALVLGHAAQNPVRIDDGNAIGTSFPGFVDLMNGLGADIAAD